MDTRDFFLGPLYILFSYGYIMAVRPRLASPDERGIFLNAYSAKVFGMVVFSLIYQFYYGGGDTFAYFAGAKIINNLLFEQPLMALKALMTEQADYSSPAYSYISRIPFFHKGIEEWNITRITAVVNFVCFNSYLATAVFYNLFSFMGLWKFYRTMRALYPKYGRYLAYGILFAPSAVFWGGGVLKDTLGLGCTFFISSAMIRMLLLRKPILREILILLACVQILTAIKVYLLFTLAGSLGLWMMFRFGSGMHPLLRLVSLPVVAAIVGIGAGVAILRAAEQSDSFDSFETIESRLEGYHTDHGRQVDASMYSLGEVEYTPVGLLSKLPASVIVTLFRPFPWEIKNIVMLVSSAESTLYLLFTLWVLFKAGVLGSLRSLLGNPEILMALSFTVALGFIVGISSYNFGALVRFKIPLLPFYGTFLAIMYGKYVAGDRPPATPQASSRR